MPNNQIKSLTVDGVTYDIVDETSGYMKGMTILSYGNSTWQDFLIAYNEQKVVYCRASSNSNPASGEQTRLAFMAYVNDADTPTEVEFQYYRSVNTHTEAQQGDQVFVYKLTSAGNWSVTTREASVKVAVSGDLTGSYSNGVYTIGGDIPTIAVEPKITTGVNIADITVDETTYELYAPTGGGGSVESVAVSNATNGGLSVSGSPITSSGTITIGHSNVLTSAQTTQAVYPIKIDKNGHISAYGSAVSIPTKVSDLTNDSGFITSYTETDPIFSASAAASITSSDITSWNNKVSDDKTWNGVTLNKTAAIQTDTIYLPYGTSSSPTEAKFVKASITPGVYVIALYDGSKYLYSTTPTTGDSSTKVATTAFVNSAIPTKVSDLTNDSGFVTTDEKVATAATTNSTTYYPTLGTDTTSAETKYYDKKGIQYTVSSSEGWLQLGNTTATSDGGKKGCLTIYSSSTKGVDIYANSSLSSNIEVKFPASSGTLALTSDIPTVPTNVSAFTNDSGYITGSDVPSNETDPTVPSWAKANTKPTYTASEVGAAATSHAHGNITSGGDITATAPTIANGDQIVINDSSASKITNGPTFDGSTTNKYLSPKGTWESLPQGTAYTAGTGLSLSGTEFNHSNSITATETVGVYPIEIDAQGHISYYGDAVNIDNFVKNYYGENISGYIDTTTSDGYGIIEYRDLSFNEDNTAQIQYGTTSHNTSSFISLSADDINIRGNINAESNKIINLGTPTASTDAATKGYVDSSIPSSAASSTTGVSISNHSTSSVTGVQSSTTTASKVTLGTAISVPNVTAAGSGSFTQGSFSGGSLTFAIDSTDNKQLNITFTAATHGADSHTHTAPTLGTAISVPNVTAATDVTVPIKDTAATTVVTSATHTVTDNGHTHSLS